MVYETEITKAHASYAHPRIRTIGLADLKDVLARGLADFNAMPSHLVFLYLIYPILAFVLIRLSFGYDILPLLFPLFAGVTLISPLAATGFYQMSQRREQGLDLSWAHVLDIRRSPSFGALVTLGIVLVVVFIAWLITAEAIYGQIFGAAALQAPESIAAFASQVFTTPEGWTLIVVGSGVGFLFAVLVLTISVISFPMLLDHDVGLGTAIQTSIRAVAANPVVMAAWGLIIVVALGLGAVPFFFGLAVVFPVLGHATWHLYRKIVEV